MKESLERIQELLSDLTDALIRGEDRIGLVENYRTEIRDEALEEACNELVVFCQASKGVECPCEKMQKAIRRRKTAALAAAASEEKGNG